MVPPVGGATENVSGEASFFLGGPRAFGRGNFARISGSDVLQGDFLEPSHASIAGPRPEPSARAALASASPCACGTASDPPAKGWLQGTRLEAEDRPTHAIGPSPTPSEPPTEPPPSAPPTASARRSSRAYVAAWPPAPSHRHTAQSARSRPSTRPSCPLP